MILSLLLTFERLYSHIYEAILGLAIREFTKGVYGTLRVVFSQRPRLFNTIALEDKLSGLFGS